METSIKQQPKQDDLVVASPTYKTLQANYKTSSLANTMIDDDEEDCSWCHGCGEGDYDGAACRKCHGTGVEPMDDDYDNYEGCDD